MTSTGASTATSRSGNLGWESASGQTTPALLSEHDEDVLIAVQALGNMRHRANAPMTLELPPSTTMTATATPSLSASTSTAPSTSTDLQSQFSFPEDRNSHFVTRVTELPIVHTALRAYEQGKASSRVVKFGAEMVESSVLTMTKPIYNRLPVDQLDDFACRQLDRISTRSNSRSPESRRTRESEANILSDNALTSSPTLIVSDEPHSMERPPSSSRWHSMLIEASGIGIAMTDDSMRRLKYCIQWLQYATSRIDQHIAALQGCIAAQSPSSQENRDVPHDTLRQRNQIKNDLLFTIKQVIDVISKYAGDTLPEPARSTVRSFFLRLPQRWASANALQEEERTTRSRPTSPAAGPEKRAPRRGRGGKTAKGTENPQPPEPTAENSATVASHKILTLAVESLDMLRNVTNIFTQSLERAESWVDRLRPGHASEDTASLHKLTLSDTRTTPLEMEPLTSVIQRPSSSMRDEEPPTGPYTYDNSSSDSGDDESLRRRPRKTLRIDPNGF